MMPIWGSLDIAIGRGQRALLGPLTLDLFRSSDAWWCATSHSDDPFHDASGQEPLQARPADARRLVFEGRPTLRPALADRAVVARPEHPVQLGPHSRSEFFLSTPLWVQIVSDAGVILDVPTTPMRSTWFGATAMDGELAYVSRTRLLQSKTELRALQHRVATRVIVENEGPSLELSRLYLPAPRLSLTARDGRLWTEDVTVSAGGEESATIGPSGKPLAPARDPDGPRRTVRRMINALMPSDA